MVGGLERSVDWSGRWTGAVARLERWIGVVDWSGGLEQWLD